MTEGQIETQRTAPETEQDDEGRRVLPPQRQRPKMTLDQQSEFLHGLLNRCKMADPELRGRFAGEALLTLTTDDMMRLEAIQQTLEIFHSNDAARLVKDAIWRKRQGGGRR